MNRQGGFEFDVERVLPDLEKRLEDDYRNPTREHSLSADEDADCSPIVVCSAISYHGLNRCVNKHPTKLQRWEYKPQTKTRGSVVVYNLPTIVHSITANEVVGMIREQIVELNPSARLLRTLHAAGNTRYDVGDRHQATDQCLILAGAPPNTYPSLVVEVAYKHETWENMIVIGVQVGLIRRRIIVMQWKVSFNYKGGKERQVLSEVVGFDFGKGHEVQLPLRALYFGVVLPDALTEYEEEKVVLDLDELRGTIRAATPRKIFRGRTRVRLPSSPISLPLTNPDVTMPVGNDLDDLDQHDGIDFRRVRAELDRLLEEGLREEDGAVGEDQKLNTIDVYPKATNHSTAKERAANRLGRSL